MARIWWDHFWGFHTRKWTVAASLSTTGGPFDNGPYILHGAGVAAYKTFPANYTEQFWGFHYNPDNLGAADFLGFRVGVGTTLASIGLNASSRTILKVGGTQVGTTGSYIFAEDVWVHLGVRYKIANSGGVLEVLVNGVVDATFTGDTQPGAETSFDTMVILTTATQHRFTNFVCDDAAYPGQVKFARRLPTGDSATNNAWTASPGPNKWANVDDTPPDDDTTYNFSGTNGQRQGHTHAAHTLPATAVVLSVITELLAKGDASLKAGVRSSTSESYSASQTLNGGAYGVIEHRTTTNPNGGGAWALGDLNASETIYETVI